MLRQPPQPTGLGQEAGPGVQVGIGALGTSERVAVEHRLPRLRGGLGVDLGEVGRRVAHHGLVPVGDRHDATAVGLVVGEGHDDGGATEGPVHGGARELPQGGGVEGLLPAAEEPGGHASRLGGPVHLGDEALSPPGGVERGHVLLLEDRRGDVVDGGDGTAHGVGEPGARGEPGEVEGGALDVGVDRGVPLPAHRGVAGGGGHLERQVPGELTDQLVVAVQPGPGHRGQGRADQPPSTGGVLDHGLLELVLGPPLDAHPGHGHRLHPGDGGTREGSEGQVGALHAPTVCRVPYRGRHSTGTSPKRPAPGAAGPSASGPTVSG